MQMLSWAYTFFVIYAPIVLSLIFLWGAGVLLVRVRSRATAIFFLGVLVTTLAPWVFNLATGTAYSPGERNIQTLVFLGATILQTFGFLYYALSLPKKSSQN